MKTPEEMANEYASSPTALECCSECRYLGFLAGYKAGREMSNKEIFDHYLELRKKLGVEEMTSATEQLERWRLRIIGIFK